MRKYNTVLTAERLRELLNYDPLTGVFSWRVNGRGRSGVGTVAGGSNHKYKRIAIDKKEYFVHRLAWLMCMVAGPPRTSTTSTETPQTIE